jgi:hypothetical protein
MRQAPDKKGRAPNRASDRHGWRVSSSALRAACDPESLVPLGSNNHICASRSAALSPKRFGSTDPAGINDMRPEERFSAQLMQRLHRPQLPSKMTVGRLTDVGVLFNGKASVVRFT